MTSERESNATGMSGAKNNLKQKSGKCIYFTDPEGTHHTLYGAIYPDRVTTFRQLIAKRARSCQTKYIVSISLEAIKKNLFIFDTIAETN